MSKRSALVKQKLALLEEIKRRKHVLFGSYNNTTKFEKEAAWKEVLAIARSLQLASADKDWRYPRDNLFGLWKSRTLAKRDNAQKPGPQWGKNCKLDAIDNIILEILERDTEVVIGLNLPESYGASGSSTKFNESIRYSKNAKKRKYQEPINERERLNSDFLNRQLKLELMKVEIYHRRLLCLRLERELFLTPSEITSYLVPIRDRRTTYPETTTDINSEIFIDVLD